MAYELIDRRTVFEGTKVHLEVHKLRDTDTDKTTTREVVRHNGAVCILPFLDDQTILLIRNRRYAVGQTLLELPAGTLEKGEDPINCAGRELQEETGYLAGRLRRLGKFFTSPGVLTEEMFAFAAFDLEETKQALEEGEDIEVVPTKFEDALAMIRDGDLRDGKTIAILLMYDRLMRETPLREME